MLTKTEDILWIRIVYRKEAALLLVLTGVMVPL